MANKILLIILFVAAGLTLLVYIHDQQSAVQAKSSAVAKLSDPDKHISVSAKRKVPPPPGQKASTDANGTMRRPDLVEPSELADGTVQPSADGTMTRTTAMEQSSADGVEPSRDGAMKSTDHVEQRERAIRVKQSRAHRSAQSVEATKVTVVVGSKNAGCTPEDSHIINTDEFTEQWMRKINGCMWPWGHSKNLKNCLVKAFKKTGLLTEACMQCSVDLIMCRKCTSGPVFRFKTQQTEKDRKEKERCSNECLEQYKKCKR
eukprot:453423_1